MTLETTKAIVLDAELNGRGVGAFNVILLEHAEAFISATQITNLPVILQISENCVTYHRGLKPISQGAIALAQEASAKIAVHLDHAESEELIREALDLGFSSVMFDGSKLPYRENVEASIRMSNLCHSYGVSIEVELGEIGGKDGVHAPGVRTNPHDAKKFVDETNVDLLAVAVGSSHAMVTRDASLDFELITQIKSEVSVPLVLHGSSGVSDSDLKRAVRAGMSKINISTHLNHIFTEQIRSVLAANPNLVDPRKYIQKAREATAVESAKLLNILALIEQDEVAR